MQRNSLLSVEDEIGYVKHLKELKENETAAEDVPEAIRAQLERMAAERRAQMSYPGTLGLPPLLDHRRQQYGIIDDAFAYGGQCAYDRLLVWLIPQWEGATYGRTKILMPDATREAEGQTAPRAVVVSAGMLALDHLRSNGMDLGHIITFANQGHWRLRVGDVGGKLQYLVILNSGDVVSSEDTYRLIRSGVLKVSCRRLEGGAPAHHYVVNDEGLAPMRPWREFDE